MDINNNIDEQDSPIVEPVNNYIIAFGIVLFLLALFGLARGSVVIFVSVLAVLGLIAVLAWFLTQKLHRSKDRRINAYDRYSDEKIDIDEMSEDQRNSLLKLDQEMQDIFEYNSRGRGKWLGVPFFFLLPAFAGFDVFYLVFSLSLIILSPLFYRYLKSHNTSTKDVLNRAKQIIIPHILQPNFGKTAIYPDQRLSDTDIDQSGLISKHNLLKGEDLLKIESYGGVELCEISLSQKVRIGKKTVSGILASSPYPFVLEGKTFVIQNDSAHLVDKHFKNYQKFTFESDEFNKLYSVYSSHGADARLALRADIMERLIHLHDEDHNIHLSFDKTGLYLWAPHDFYTDLFQVNYYDSFLSGANRVMTQLDIQVLIDLVKSLKLYQNT